MELEKQRICELVDIRSGCGSSTRELLLQYIRRGWRVIDVIQDIHPDPVNPSRYLIVILERGR